MITSGSFPKDLFGGKPKPSKKTPPKKGAPKPAPLPPRKNRP